MADIGDSYVEANGTGAAADEQDNFAIHFECEAEL